MARHYYAGGGRFEKVANYSRALSVGPFAFVSGTTAMEPTGKLHAPWDSYAQTIYIFKRIEDALDDMGFSLNEIVKTTVFLSDMQEVAGFARAHGELFAGITPTLTAVEAGLTTEGMMVEISVDAYKE